MGLVYCRKETVAQSFSIKMIFLKISQNSQESICARVSRALFGSATLFKNRLWHRCLPVIFAKILKASTL